MATGGIDVSDLIGPLEEAMATGGIDVSDLIGPLEEAMATGGIDVSDLIGPLEEIGRTCSIPGMLIPKVSLIGPLEEAMATGGIDVSDLIGPLEEIGRTCSIPGMLIPKVSLIGPVEEAMATGGIDVSDLIGPLEEIGRTCTIGRTCSIPGMLIPKVSLKLLLWNIHGDTSTGMAAAREMLVQVVYNQCKPDIFLLQEVVTPSKCLPTGNYYCQKSKLLTEACILCDAQFFVSQEVNIQGIIGNRRLLSDEAAPSTRTAGGISVDQSFYNNHSCAIRLRHRLTRNEFVLMSFHNVSTRTGGTMNNVISCAKGFIKLVCLVHAHEGVPVIAGGDFNCDHSHLQVYAEGLGCELPDYNTSLRRMLQKKIDLFVVKDSPPYSVSGKVDVVEVLPLVDPTSKEADFHPLGRESIRHLVDNAPVNKKTGIKLTWQDYTRVTNHDPMICWVELAY